MAWTVSNPVSIGVSTKKSHYDKAWDNIDFFKINHNVDGTHKGFIMTSATESYAIKIRHGGQTGEVFNLHPAGAEAALYITGKHTNPPACASGLDIANFSLFYEGDLSVMDGTLETVEIVSRTQNITVSPTQAHIGLEIAVGPLGGNTGITFPQVIGIMPDVNMPNADGGTITEANSLMPAMPSAIAGSIITNARALYIPGSGTLVGGAITNAYSIYLGVPQAGTNRWGLYITDIGGTVAGTTPFEVKAGDPGTGLIARFNRYNDTGTLIIGTVGSTHSVIGVEKELRIATTQSGQNLGTDRAAFEDDGDLKLFTSGKGVVLTNAGGTVTKRVRLNDAGNGLIYEDP